MKQILFLIVLIGFISLIGCVSLQSNDNITPVKNKIKLLEKEQKSLELHKLYLDEKIYEINKRRIALQINTTYLQLEIERLKKEQIENEKYNKVFFESYERRR